MAKNKQQNKQQNRASNAAATGSGNKVQSFGQLSVLKEQVQQAHAQIADESLHPSPAMPQSIQVDEAGRRQLEEIMGELRQLKNDLVRVTAARDAAKNGFERDQDKNKLAKEEIAKEKSAVAGDLATLAVEKAAFAALKGEMETKARDLEVRELESRNGFAKQNEVALVSLREDIQRLEQQRSELLRRLDQDREEASLKLVDFERAKQEHWMSRESALSQQQTDLEIKARTLEIRRARLDTEDRDMQASREQFREDVRAESALEVQTLEDKLFALNDKLAKQFAKHNALHNEYLAAKELLGELGGGDPKALLQEIDHLRQENRDLKRQTQMGDVASMRVELNAVIGERDALRLKHQDDTRTLGELNAQRVQRQTGVLERETLEQEKRVLLRHKEALSAAVGELEMRLNQLTKSRESQAVFPALIELDRPEVNPKLTRLEDVPDLKTFCTALQHRIALAEKDVKLYYSSKSLRLFMGGLAMSRLHVFQGISGTGKTSLAKAFTKAVGGYCTIVPVQAGWRDRDDLIGHYNSFENRYYEGECLKGIYRAQTDAWKDRVNVILLDEMNLSRPEQYFAEFLSALEINTESDRLITLRESELQGAPALFIEKRKIRLPSNVWFIGTANHDETTNELADKTYDRAHVMNLPRHEERFDIKPESPAAFSYSSLQSRFYESQKKHGAKVKELLVALTQGGLATVLADEFGVGLGNRLERQAAAFLPVVVESGGTFAEGLDHLLATRIFRSGKVTKRYDTTKDQIDLVREELQATWQRMGLESEPGACVELLADEGKRIKH